MAVRLSKARAAYRNSEVEGEICNRCRFFIPEEGGTIGECELVEGGIDKNFTSDLYRYRGDQPEGQGLSPPPREVTKGGEAGLKEASPEETVGEGSSDG